MEMYPDQAEKSIPEITEHLNKTWKTIMQDQNHHMIEICRNITKLKHIDPATML